MVPFSSMDMTMCDRLLSTMNKSDQKVAMYLLMEAFELGKTFSRAEHDKVMQYNQAFQP